MLFIRAWQTLYLLTLTLSLLNRLGMWGSYYGSTTGEIPVNVIAIAATIASWVMFEKGLYWGGIFVRVLSVSRILVILTCASAIFGFIAAYVPTGPALWLHIIRLFPSPLFWVVCLILLVCEGYFFLKVGRLQKQTHRKKSGASL